MFAVIATGGVEGTALQARSSLSFLALFRKEFMVERLPFRAAFRDRPRIGSQLGPNRLIDRFFRLKFTDNDPLDLTKDLPLLHEKCG